MVPTLIAFLALAVLIAAVQIQVRVVEEPYLCRTHGQLYLHYATSAGRFLPASDTRGSSRVRLLLGRGLSEERRRA